MNGLFILFWIALLVMNSLCSFVYTIVISCEVIVQKGVRRLTGIDLANSIPYPVSVIYTSMVTTFFAPFFFNPRKAL
jgi:energy-coupling factor transporter transmembrane protein EcfT